MIKITRYIQDTPKLFSDQIHGVLKIKTPTGLFVCETLERPYRDNRKEMSCLKPGIYKIEIINPLSEFPFIQIHGTGRLDNRIQVFRESPIWIGTEKVFNIDSGLYEFADFRDTLKELCKIQSDTITISQGYTNNLWSPHTPIITLSTFKASDDELIHLPSPRTD